MSLLLTELDKTVSRNIEQIKMLHKNSSTEIIINSENQSSNQIDYFLKEVKITNVPTENVWIFESEDAPNECLKGGGKAVERTIVFLQNPDYQLNSEAVSSNFSIDFETILQKLTS